MQGCRFKHIYGSQFQRNVINNYIKNIATVCNGQPIIFKTYANISTMQLSTHPAKLNNPTNSLIIYRNYSDTKTEKILPITLTNAEKLKKAVKEYGSTVIVFHIGISLISLGVIYLLVSSGVDLTTLLEKVGLSNERINKLAGNAGTFVVAYAIHKVFAPVRIGITLTATPFIVRHLRNKGWLKK